MTPIPGDRLVTVFGGSGFVGRHVVRALARSGWRIRVAVRRPDLAFHLQPIGRVGQIHAVQANLRVEDSVQRAAEGSDAIVNLVGILYESGKQRFDAVQGAGTAAVARAAAANKAKLVQFSAIGADANSNSGYARSKAAGEAAAREAVPEAVIVRPSIVFGPEDSFFNRFAAMASVSPVLPLVGGGQTKFQPVFVGDVAAAVDAMLAGKAKPGSVYELGGPDVRTFEELMKLMLQTIGRKRLLVPVPFAVASMKAFFLEMLPRPLLTRDQVRLLRNDNVVSEEAIRDGRTLQGLGIAPTSMEAVIESYLVRFRPTGQFWRPAA